MFIELLPKILTSLFLGLGIGVLDLLGMFLTFRFFCAGKKGNKIFLVFIASEMIRLSFVLGILLLLSFNKSLSFGWLVAGPLALTVVKFIYAYTQIKKL